MAANDQELVDRTRQIMDETGLSWKMAWLRAKAELHAVEPIAVSQSDIEARTRALMLERGLGWQDAWFIAEAEATGGEPRKRSGCIGVGLPLAFWSIVGFFIYMLSTLLMLFALKPLFPSLADDWGPLVALGGMALAAVATVLLARRFRSLPVMLMAAVLLLVGGSFVGFVVYQVASGPSPESIEASQRHDDLVSALDLAVSSVSIPADWDVQFQGASPYSQSVGYMASPDLSSSGTRMLISVAVNDGDNPQDGFWRELEASLDHGNAGTLVDEPIATSLSGVEGHLFEISDLKGNKTGQELGAYYAVFFGPEYTYQLVIQFELPDRDDMSLLYRNTVARLTFVEGASDQL